MNSSTVRVAFCSFGVSGKVFHAPFFSLHKGFELYACWERSKKIVNEHYPDVISYDTLENLLADPAVDLVVINTPSVTHFQYAKQALQAGKDIIVEKPFVATVSQGEELIKLAEEKGRFISVFQNRRWDPDFLTVKQVIEQKLLGKLVEAELHFDRYAVELSPKAHKETGEKGTGVLYDLGSHLIDQALVLFGWPNAVFADLRTVRPVSSVHDYFELLLYYDDLRVRLHSSVMARENSLGYLLHGELGSFVKSRTNVQEEALMAGISPATEGWGEEQNADWGLLNTELDGKLVKEIYTSIAGNYMSYFDGLYKAITGKEQMPVTARQGLDVIRVIEAANQSSVSKSVITIDATN